MSGGESLRKEKWRIGREINFPDAPSKGESGYFKMEHVFIRFAAGTDHRIAGHTNPRGHEVRVRGCEIPHAEARAQATLVDGSLHP